MRWIGSDAGTVNLFQNFFGTKLFENLKKTSFFRLKSIKNVVHAGTMLTVLLTLFDYCVRVRENRVLLFNDKLKTVDTLLTCLKPVKFLFFFRIFVDFFILKFL